MIDNTKIAILTTVANFNLYNKTSKFFPRGIRKYVIDGTNGMYGIHSIKYMMKRLKGKGIEWLIMADEDVIFTKSNTVFSLIEEMKKQDITVCGVRDGGIIAHRKQNPFAINTFFSILNFKEVEAIWNKKEVLQNQYTIENEFKDDLSNLEGEFNVKSLYEPYYCFYFWLRRQHKKIKFLDAKICKDEISNTVLFNDKVFLFHTWYARSYQVNKKHTDRINTILDFQKKESRIRDDEVIIFKSKLFAFKQKMEKNYRRIRNKLVK